MTRNEVKALAEKYNMEILRNPITREAHSVMCDSEELIPELDALAEQTAADGVLPCGVMRENMGDLFYRYTIVCPTSWFDLWGWADE